VPLEITVMGEYYLFVSGFGVMAYDLTLRVVDAPARNSGAITPGAPVLATLATGAEDAWTFEGQQGDVYAIALTSLDDAFDTVLSITNAEGAEVAYDDDGGQNRNSALQHWEVPADGVYTIRVSSYRRTEGGPYRLTLELIAVRRQSASLPGF